jgi:hypothetical protein
MVKDVFATILEELGSIFKLRLTPDRNNACLVRFKTGLNLHMEFDGAQEKIVIVSELGTPPLGRYRENLFREALKSNGLPPPKNGVFAYSKKNDSLVLYSTIAIADLSGQKLADFLLPFMQKADLWRASIVNNEVPSFLGNELSFGSSGGGIFGLK